MKKSCCAARERSVVGGKVHGLIAILLCGAAFLPGNPCLAENYPLRVVYADVPGTEEIEAGRFEAGIRILQAELKKVDTLESGDIWSTLCATYVVTRAYSDARTPCDKAVEIEPTYAALNNRGVYRAFVGDFYGARQDLDRARPLQLEAYIVELTTKDPRVVAAENFRLIDNLLSKRNADSANSSVASTSASIEDLEKLVSRQPSQRTLTTSRIS